jgi:hypothetical protein
MPVYTAPPAPANAEPVAWLWSHRKHPSEVTLVRPEDDERAEGAHWSGGVVRRYMLSLQRRYLCLITVPSQHFDTIALEARKSFAT